MRQHYVRRIQEAGKAIAELIKPHGKKKPRRRKRKSRRSFASSSIIIPNLGRKLRNFTSRSFTL